MSNRTLLRLGCITTAVLLIMVGIVMQNTLQMQRYRRQLEAGYTRSLQELSGQLNAISADMQKAGYAGTPAQISAISAEVWKNASSAKAALGNIPAGEADLDEIYRFLSQVGNYSMYLSGKSVRGEEITEEERGVYDRMTAYCRELTETVGEMESALQAGELDLDHIWSDERWVRTGDELPVLSSDSVALEQHLESYPTLIYDGPFSDHLLQKDPQMLRSAPAVTLSQAQEAAARFAGVSGGAIQPTAEEDSHMPSVIFSTDSAEVGVTKLGGYVTYLVDGRAIGPKNLSIDEGRNIAGEYLSGNGIADMRETYYELAAGVLTVNFAYRADGVLCYTDLIKVGVALDDGGIVFYDARGYLNNHRERTFDEPLLSVAEAEQSLSSRLTPEKVQRALVPTAGADEVLCYEFLCTGQEGEHALVYVNADTGAEQQIFILIESAYGTLAI